MKHFCFQMTCINNQDGGKNVLQPSESECLFHFQKIFGAQKELLVFGAHFGAERGLKTTSNSMSRCVEQ